MKTLTEYISENRKGISSVTTEDKWWGEMYSGMRAVFYDVPTVSAQKKVFAFIGYPKTEKPANGYPAVLLIHGGNGGAFYEMARLWADRGFVTICPDFNGKYAYSINDRQRVNPDGGNAGYGAIEDLHDENNWAYFSVLSAMRAIDVLLSLDCVDKNNIFSCGLSWGGFLQLMLSAVDDRIKASSVIYSSAYVSESEWGKKRLENLSESDREIWNDNIDPKNYLNDIKRPVFFTAGADDIAFKMEGRRKTAESIKAPVYFGLRKNFPHGNFIGFEQPESVEFFKRIADGKDVTKPSVTFKDGKLTVKAFDEKSELKLYYTKDDVVTTETQDWLEIKITDGETVKIKNDVTAFFVSEKLTDGTQWSSNIIRGDL